MKFKPDETYFYWNLNKTTILEGKVKRSYLIKEKDYELEGYIDYDGTDCNMLGSMHKTKEDCINEDVD